MVTYSKVIRQMRQISHGGSMFSRKQLTRDALPLNKYLDPCRLPEVLYRYRVAELVFSNNNLKKYYFFFNLSSLVICLSRDLFIFNCCLLIYVYFVVFLLLAHTVPLPNKKK